MTHRSMNVGGGADILSSLRLHHALHHQGGGDHPVHVVTDDHLDVLAAPDHLGVVVVVVVDVVDDPGPRDSKGDL